MALTNMQVFIDNARELVVEKLGQQIALFNAASNNPALTADKNFDM